MYRAGVVVSLAALANVASAGLYPGITTDNHTCSLIDPILSCTDQANPDIVDTCCTETFGGLVLQTQFWNTYTGLESEGQKLPQKSWTIHGLWPDFCNGSYTQYCDLSRQYDPEPYPNTTDGTPSGTPVPPYTGEPIEGWFEGYGKLDLLAYMKKFWLGLNQSSWILWAHEYSKHATCFSSFQTECFGPKAPELEDLFVFFETTISFYRELPTWKWLSCAGINPSNSTAYSIADIQDALIKGFGAAPYVGCSGPKYNETEEGQGSTDAGRTVLTEVWYYHHVRGAPQLNDGVRVPADIQGGSLGNCAKADNAVWYYQRTNGSEW